MPKISELTDITTLAVGDKIPVLDVSDTGTPNPAGTVKYTTPAEIKTYVLGKGVEIGTGGTGNIVTTDGSQKLNNKDIDRANITNANISGETNIGDGCIMTTPVLVSPDINGGTIDGAAIDDTTTLELIDSNSTSHNVAASTLINTGLTQTLSNKTLIDPVMASLAPKAGVKLTFPDSVASDTVASLQAKQTLTNKRLTTPIVEALYADENKTYLLSMPQKTDTLVGKTTTDTLTNKTLTTPTITNPVVSGGTMTGVAIDSTSTLNSKTITAIFAEKADVVTAAQSCTLKLANGVGTTDTVTLAEILAAAGIGAGYAVLATSVTATLYVDDTTFNYVPITQSGGVTIKITKDTGSGVAATLKEIGIAGLSGGEEYYLALGFKLVASS